MDRKRRTASAALGIVAVVTATVLLSLMGRTEPSLSDAVSNGNHELARILLKQGVDPGQPRVNGYTPLMRAAIRDDGKMVRLLLRAGADPEATAPAGGVTAVHVAAIADSPEALAALIEDGADPGHRSRSGRSAMDHAAATGSVEVIAVLAGAGLDLDARSAAFVQVAGYPMDVGPTPLAIAAIGGRTAAVAKLLELGADVDGASDRGRTPLLHAVASGQGPELITVLLDAGAAADGARGCGQDCAGPDGGALAWARDLGSPELVALLERHVGLELAAAEDPSMPEIRAGAGTTTG